MDEILAGIVPNPADAEREGGALEVGQGCSWDADVEGAAFQMQAAFRHFVTLTDEVIVVFR